MTQGKSVEGLAEAQEAAKEIGFPVIVSAEGCGTRGKQFVVDSDEEMPTRFVSAQAHSPCGRVFVQKL